MACARCRKKAQAQFTPASSEGQRPRPALRQRPVNRPAAAKPGRFAPGIQPAEQPSPPKGG